ncbi:Fe-S cluster assembly sulfur transfer protein SufU [Limosilactobacillus mucosae]|uniref:Fe-S cluster assembly sulfur transfer protein SufU n=1 Tax=Limosilactobacillus mucosae TaxID=97478 RepID=UPI0025A3F686|nr:SUF system NifU family Fe-S cluster assembly protein [Limosilactobacillus mucosae]MDM8219221.1 SUF system NifU family Fe-S cluster assembly protein [Limosilactobacillus mucosae]MDM8313877.1 SUF system NifU family Fe-S cluster assembly protein [Limosilactobacillus mucosae]
MGLSRLNYLYRAVVLEHASHPHHQGAMLDADAQTTLHNPTCGDTINLAVKVDHDHISDLMFTGSGCTISQASASMMGDVLIGQSVDDAKKLIHDFSELIMGKEISSQAQDQLKDAAILGSVAQFPTRIKCAALAWHAAQELLG